MDSMSQINEAYGQLIWYVARRYSLVGLEPLDVYHDVLLSCAAAINSGSSLADKGRMRSVVISAAIDSCRRELKHQRKRTSDNLLDDAYPSPGIIAQTKWGAQDDVELQEQILALLPLLDAQIVCEFLWPSDSTQDIAINAAKRAALEAAQGTVLRMNWHDALNAKVMKKHVAEALDISPARVSAAFKHVRARIDQLI